MKKDYKKLEKILSKMESDEYFFQSMKTDVEYINIFSKFRKKGGRVEAKDRRNKFIDMPVPV